MGMSVCVQREGVLESELKSEWRENGKKNRGEKWEIKLNELCCVVVVYFIISNNCYVIRVQWPQIACIIWI